MNESSKSGSTPTLAERRLRRSALVLAVVSAILAVSFMALSRAVVKGRTEDVDRNILLAMREPTDSTDPVGPLWFEEACRDITALGGTTVLTLLSATVIAFFWLAGIQRASAYGAIAILSALLLSHSLKAAFDRPRPDLVPHGSHVYNSSFPSGHSTMSAAVYLTMGLVAARFVARRRLKALLLATALLVTAAVGASRVYLGVHWPTDVLAGWFVGAAWALVCWCTAAWLQDRGILEQDLDHPWRTSMLPNHLRSIGVCVTLTWAAAGVARAADEEGGKQLAALLDDMWNYRVEQDPLFATSVGDHRFNDRLPRVSVEDSDRRHEMNQEFQKRLNEIDRDSLSAADRVHYDIAARELRELIAEHEFQSHFTPITSRSGFHVEFPELRRDVPLNTVKDYENYIARLRAFDDFATGHIELMRAGIKADKTLPNVILIGFEPTVETHIVDDPKRSLLYEPLVEFPATLPESERQRLRDEAKAAILEGVVVGYRRFRDFMRDEYVPRARGPISASALPDGRDFYRFRVRRFTTLDMTPDEVHQRGLAEVARIRAEMEAIIDHVEFEGDVSAFVEHLRNEERFYAETPEALLKEASFILKRIDGELPLLFGRLPRMPYGLRPVPDYVAPRTTSAYYQRPTGDGTRAGFFYLNTYNLQARPLFALEALALHEAVPGHHLQLAIQQELADLPKFRRFSDCTAFIEGWALYAERLGLEAGFYTDPYSDFGRLSMEMWRACRLVVDTGIHYFDWSRQRAIQFMADNSAESQHNIEAEIDRYIGWPGQALAYKTGELKIRELRALAEKELGERFDVRAFHDAVLGGGAVPLDVLEANIKAWIAEQKDADNAA
jgi:uncharacterized protein (DUF885 family)/membrane-associated phospholipid phosphatase